MNGAVVVLLAFIGTFLLISGVILIGSATFGALGAVLVSAGFAILALAVSLVVTSSASWSDFFNGVGAAVAIFSAISTLVSGVVAAQVVVLAGLIASLGALLASLFAFIEDPFPRKYRFVYSNALTRGYS